MTAGRLLPHCPEYRSDERQHLDDLRPARELVEHRVLYPTKNPPQGRVGGSGSRPPMDPLSRVHSKFVVYSKLRKSVKRFSSNLLVEKGRWINLSNPIY